jgi:hypothetical protein
MRMLAVILLTVSQFTVFPFLAVVAANDKQREQQIAPAYETVNVTVIHKTTL